MSVVNRLPRCTPESQGISSAAISKFVEAVEKEINELHSLMLLRHGAVVAEGWWSPYSPTRPHMLFSLSKSFTSTAVGMAVAEGRLTVDDRVLSFFPDEAPAQISKNLDTMQVRHLLSMSTGHAIDTTEYLHKRRDGNWIKAFLARPVKYKPGTFFLYNTGATYMLSAIVQKLTGMTLLDYLQPRLFEPLGIKNPTWELSPQGINTGGYGLSITTEDIARFGQLYLQKGQWNGKQLLSEACIDEATSYQSDNSSSNASIDWQQGYGYQFWQCQHGAYRGDGAFGQYCIVMPEQNAVIAITGGVTNMQAVLDLVWSHLLPAMQAEPLPEQTEQHDNLLRKLGALAYLPPQGSTSSSTASCISKKTFVLEPNLLRLKTISFDFSKPEPVITLRNGHRSHRITCGPGEWREDILTLVDHSPYLITSGVWSDENTFVLTLRFYETPFVNTLVCHFAGDGLTIEGEVNVSFGPTTFSLKGEIKP